MTRSLIIVLLLLTGCRDVDYEQACFYAPLGQVMEAGDTTTFEAGFVDHLTSNCYTVDAEHFAWRTSDDNVLRVDERGRVRAVAPGEAELIITAIDEHGETVPRTETGEAVRKARTVRVIPEIGRLEILPADTTIAVGDTVVYNTRLYASSGEEIASLRESVETSNYAIAKYAGNEVIGREPGQVTVASRALINSPAAARLTVVEGDQ